MVKDVLLQFAPELAGDSRIDFMIEQASLSINCRAWGDKAETANALLAAHYLTRFNERAGPAVGGAVTQEKVGDLQTQYAAIEMKGDEELVTTAYGARYAQMRRALGVRGITIGGPGWSYR
jgi:uncharacterized protein DUF4054